MLRWLNTVVVSDEEKARTTGQAGTGKARAKVKVNVHVL